MENLIKMISGHALKLRVEVGPNYQVSFQLWFIISDTLCQQFSESFAE